MGRGQGELRQARTRAGTAWGRLTAIVRPRPGGRSSHQVHRLQLGLALTVAALVIAL
ncbi:MAG: hypothetical protein JWM05_3058, partial [Acidimicrobiales bacterium]|nr:hypothetical protein [Acidimicrobiales bacterium]